MTILKTTTQWKTFINTNWTPDARRLVYELSELTRAFERKALLSDEQVINKTVQIESLRELLHTVEENLNIIQTREY